MSWIFPRLFRMEKVMTWQEAMTYCAKNPNKEVISKRGFKRRITEKGQAQRYDEAQGGWYHSAINPLGQPYRKAEDR